MADDDLRNQIVELLEQGNKIAAIKRFSQSTGMKLADAKARVEAIERGIRGEIPQGLDPKSLTPEQLMQEVLALARQGKYLWAIKTYGEATGKQLKESREAVDGLMRAHGLEPPKSGCGLAAMFGVLVSLFCAGLAAYLMFAT